MFSAAINALIHTAAIAGLGLLVWSWLLQKRRLKLAKLLLDKSNPRRVLIVEVRRFIWELSRLLEIPYADKRVRKVRALVQVDPRPWLSLIVTGSIAMLSLEDSNGMDALVRIAVNLDQGQKAGLAEQLSQSFRGARVRVELSQPYEGIT